MSKFLDYVLDIMDLTSSWARVGLSITGKFLQGRHENANTFFMQSEPDAFFVAKEAIIAQDAYFRFNTGKF